MAVVILVLMGSAVAGIYLYRQWFHVGDHIGIAQAAAAIIFGAPSLFLSVGAVIVGLRAAQASEAQAQAANEQTLAARAQSALATAQLKEALRPVLAISRAEFGENATFDSDLPGMQMHNVGSGTACRLTIARFEQGPFHGRNITSSFPMISTVIPSGIIAKIPNLPDELEDDTPNILIFYESTSGDRYCSSYVHNEDEPILNYEDDPATWPG